MSVGFFQLAVDRPSVTALVDAHREVTWQQFDDRVNRLVRSLRSAGLERGDHLAMLMGNRIEFFEVLGAAIKGGFVVTPVNWHLTDSEVAYVVADSDAKVLIVDDAHLATASSALALSTLLTGLVTGAEVDHPRTSSYESFIDGVDGSPLPLDEAPGGLMQYTSGTTGQPKGVERSLGPAGSTVRTLPAILQATGDMLGIGHDGAHLVTGPLYHGGPLGFSLIALNAGNTVVIMDRWSPEATLRLIETWRITNTHMVPTMFVRLLRLPDDARAAFDASSLGAVVHGAAPCSVDVKTAMMEWWGPVLHEYYGATEGGATSIGPHDWLEHQGSVGRPASVYAIEIRDDDGTELPVGQSGTIWFRFLLGTSTFTYHNDEAKTSAAHLEPSVFTLGDIGRVDADGYLYLTDRKSDMIISGGVNIYPIEIEQVLATHVAVADVAVFGIPDDEWGEQVHAVIELMPGHEPASELGDELIQFCRGRLAAYKCPRSVAFERELPRHPTGKLYKRLLRDRFWAAAARNI